MSNDDNFYNIGGKTYNRVTRILSSIRSEELEIWRGRVGNVEANRIIKQSEKVGTTVHKHIEESIVGKPFKPGKNVEVNNCLRAFGDYLKVYPISPIVSTELVVFSDTYQYAGTVDMLEPGVLVDWKTSSRISDKHWLQVSAYASALEECLGKSVDKLRIVRLDKSLGIYEVQEKPLSECFGYIQAFRHLANFYSAWNVTINGGEHEDGDDTEDGEIKAVDRPKVPNDRCWENRKV